MRSRLLLLLVVTLVFGISGGALANDVPPGGTFFDDDGNTHEGAIEAIASEGITRGCNPPQNTNYCPDDFVTRGQMAAFLVRAFGYTDDGGGDLFVDDDGSTFESDIDKLGTEGVTRGCNPPANDRFCPDDFVTRGQMAAFLVRALGLTDDGGGDRFVDDDGSTFESDIDKLGAAEITKGCNPPANDRFCPDDFVLRDQMASFLSRARDLAMTVPPARTDTSHGDRLNLLEIAAAQGCNVIGADRDGVTDVCAASTSMGMGDVFFVRHGWLLEDWSSRSAAEQQAFASDSTRFDLSLNGLQLDLFETFAIQNDEASDSFRFQFQGNLRPTTHRFVGEWVWDDVVELRVILDVTVTP